MNNLTKRVLMALWGIPLILGLTYLGGFYFLFLILLINGMSLWEFYTIFQKKDIHAYRFLGLALSTIFLLVDFWFTADALIIMSLAVLVGILTQHLKVSRPNTSLNTILTMAGIFYISLFLAALLKLRLEFDHWTGLPEGTSAGGRYLILMWLAIWLCDTAAYFGGRLMGRHKLAPQTSPNKTIEGAISGLIASFLTFIALGPVLVAELPASYLWISGGVIGIFGQLGDLVESRFKRDAGVKDTSSLLPGHGGFLDRFDSVIFVAPLLLILFFYYRP